MLYIDKNYYYYLDYLLLETISYWRYNFINELIVINGGVKMRKRMRKWIPLTLVFLLVLVSFPFEEWAGAQEQADGSHPSKEATVNLDLTRCLELGLENNYDLQLAKQQIEDKKNTLEEAKFTKKKLEDAQDAIRKSIIQLRDAINTAINQGWNDAQLKAYTGYTYYDLQSELNNIQIYTIDSYEEYQVRDVLVPASEIAYGIVQSYYDHAILQIGLLINKQYNDVITAQKMLEVKQASLDRAKYQLKLAQDAYDVGMKAKDDLMLAKLQIAKMEAEVERAKNELYAAETELKKTLGLDMDTSILLKENWITEQVSYELKDGIAQALEKRPEIVETQGKEEIAKMNFHLVKRVLTSNTFKYKQIASEYEKAQIISRQRKADIEAEVRCSYNSLQTAWNVLQQVKDNVQYAQENLRIVTDRYREGMEDMLPVLQAQEMLRQAEEGYIQACSAYQLALAKYRSDIVEQLSE
jgi:outer membrane protein TolC